MSSLWSHMKWNTILWLTLKLTDCSLLPSTSEMQFAAFHRTFVCLLLGEKFRVSPFFYQNHNCQKTNENNDFVSRSLTNMSFFQDKLIVYISPLEMKIAKKSGKNKVPSPLFHLLLSFSLFFLCVLSSNGTTGSANPTVSLLLFSNIYLEKKHCNWWVFFISFVCSRHFYYFFYSSFTHSTKHHIIPKSSKAHTFYFIIISCLSPRLVVLLISCIP